jgi:o-succinylbenzoate synthase
MAAGDGATLTAAGVADDSRPVSLRLVRVRVPLRTPHRAAHGTERERDVILVRWTRPDGFEGWAECPTLTTPGYPTGTTEEAWVLLRSAAARAAGSAAPAAVGAAGAALLDARLDAHLRAIGSSLRSHLGGSRPAVERCAVLAGLGDPPEQQAEAARRAVEGGAAMVKVKIAPGRDLEILSAVIGEVGAAATAADCNGSYGGPDQLDGVDRLGLRYLEQPFPAALGLDRLAVLQRRLRTPVALDESLTSAEAVESALTVGAADVLSVKPARLGGVEAAARSVALATSAGRDAFVGGMLELGIGRSFAAAVASLPGCTLPTDLGPSARYVETDVCEPVVLDDRGWLLVPDGPGCGRLPDEGVLASYAVEDIDFDW